MQVFTFNVNGIRAALNKGLLDWLRDANPDVLCIQEIKMDDPGLIEPLFTNLGYYCEWYPAEKKGYSGVAILSKIKPTSVTKGFGVNQYDSEGRTILAEFDQYSLVCAYFPSGTTGDARQSIKMDFLDDFFNYANQLKESGKPLLVAGDVNICHTEIDIHNPKANAKTSGFLPEERAWVGKFIDSGFLDSFRVINNEPHQYSWWSYRAGARGKNLGWRIDYIFTANLDKNRIIDSKIYSDVFMSDHCPVGVDYNFN